MGDVINFWADDKPKFAQKNPSLKPIWWTKAFLSQASFIKEQKMACWSRYCASAPPPHLPWKGISVSPDSWSLKKVFSQRLKIWPDPCSGNASSCVQRMRVVSAMDCHGYFFLMDSVTEEQIVLTSSKPQPCLELGYILSCTLPGMKSLFVKLFKIKCLFFIHCVFSPSFLGCEKPDHFTFLSFCLFSLVKLMFLGSNC